MTPFHPRDTVPVGVFFLFPNREGGLLNSNDYVAFFSAFLVYFWGIFSEFWKIIASKVRAGERKKGFPMGRGAGWGVALYPTSHLFMS